jgi:translation initiation factor IF-2
MKLEIVLKCDVAGSVEPVTSSIASLRVAETEISVIRSGVGNVTKSDVLMALTGSRLIIGFNVDITHKLQEFLMEQGVEVRLYDVIYKLVNDVKKIAVSLRPREPEERTLGRGKIIAVFRGKKTGVIAGCEIEEGVFERGKPFRVISAMGPVYSGRIESLQVERLNVRTGKAGQNVGILITDWEKARVGDLIETFEPLPHKGPSPWKPTPGIFRD